MALLQQDHEQALAFSQESLHLFGELGHRFGQALALHNRGYVELLRGRVEQAVASFVASLALFQELGDTWGIALALTGPARIAVETGPGPAGAYRAILLLSAADALRTSLPGQLSRYHHLEIGRTSALASEYLDRSQVAAGWVEGHALSCETVLLLAVDGLGAATLKIASSVDSR
jgi:hypothetical protein